MRSDDPLLHVYSSTQEKLEAITEQYNKAKLKVVFCFIISIKHSTNLVKFLLLIANYLLLPTGQRKGDLVLICSRDAQQFNHHLNN